jgi:predicted Rossmann fold flavoprotein
VGAGAAGLLAAIFAARAGLRVAILETRPTPGAKIRVSGGGRCNVLPSRVSLDDFATSGSRNTLRNVLFSWPLEDVRRFFEAELRLPLKVEPTGKVFPVSDSARDVIAALLGECARVGVDVLGGRRVTRVEPAVTTQGPGFVVETDSRERFESRRLVLSTGGLSLPRTGSDGGGLAIAQALGHSVRALHPALVPLTTSATGWKELAGLSLRAKLKAVESGSPRALEEREGDLLFTHRGFSGPVVLDLSRHVTSGSSGQIEIVAAWGGWDAARWDASLRSAGNRTVAAIARDTLPRRLVERLYSLAGVSESRTTSELRREDRRKLAETLGAFRLPVDGTEGYATAEVTGGGVPLEEVSPRTLESRIVPGLHLAGEMLDCVGRIGGYNFLWAWVTGRRAGEGAAGGTSGGIGG